MNNEEVIKVIYEFIKTKITVMDLSQFIPSDEDFEKFKIAKNIFYIAEVTL